jgi:hypothetical protein
MPSPKYTQTYKKVSDMGVKLKKDTSKDGPSNDDQLHVRTTATCLPKRHKTFGRWNLANTMRSCTRTPRSQKARTSALRRSQACSILLYVLLRIYLFAYRATLPAHTYERHALWRIQKRCVLEGYVMVLWAYTDNHTGQGKVQQVEGGR